MTFGPDAGVQVSGKTGTAQVFKHSAGVDADLLPKAERDHAWFVGYAADDRPRIAFAIVVEHGGHGGTSAAPIARRVLQRFFEPRDEDVVGTPGGTGAEEEIEDARTTAAR